MSGYRIHINDRTYEGDYDSAPNAVFGAMLKDRGEMQREHADWRAAQLVLGNTLGGKLSIEVEYIGTTTPKKVHRIA